MGVVNRILFVIGFLMAVVLGPGPATAVITHESRPAPVFTCDKLTATLVEGTSTTYDFQVDVTIKNGARLTGVLYEFGDGKGNFADTLDSVRYTYKSPYGTRMVKAHLQVYVGDKIMPAVTCQTTITLPTHGG